MQQAKPLRGADMNHYYQRFPVFQFSAQSELNNFFDFFRLAVADKNGHDPSIFAKEFEAILRHVLRDKMTPLYLEICFVTSYPRMTRLTCING